MNRRSFLRTLGVGVAVVAAAPSVVAALEPICQIQPQAPVVINAVIAQYSDYANFSDFVIASAIDASVSEAANELSKELGLKIEALHRQTFQYSFPQSPLTQAENSETLSTTPSAVGSDISSRITRRFRRAPARRASSSSTTRFLQTQRG